MLSLQKQLRTKVVHKHRELVQLRLKMRHLHLQLCIAHATVFANNLQLHCHEQDGDNDKTCRHHAEARPEQIVWRKPIASPLSEDLNDILLIRKRPVDVSHLASIPFLIEEAKLPGDIVEVVEEGEAEGVENNVFGTVLGNDEEGPHAQRAQQEAPAIHKGTKPEPELLGRAKAQRTPLGNNLEGLHHVNDLDGILRVLPHDIDTVHAEEQDEEQAENPPISILDANAACSANRELHGVRPIAPFVETENGLAKAHVTKGIMQDAHGSDDLHHNHKEEA
mmetsp:Transcript_94556/g.210162  ORF Transcript_94556/g.210162 Transcript_94556/m.210162 type:complete len:279 (+) Transcript_94556:255-1091(+)